MTTSDSDAKSHNASIAKGLSVLEAFDRGRPSLTLTELIEITGLEKTAVHRFAATLVKLGYLRKDSVRRHYTIAPKLLHLGTTYLRTNPLIERAMPHLAEWNRKFNETINLAEMDDSLVIVSYRMRSKKAIGPDISIGSYIPWHATSSGQIIVANMTETDRASLLRRTKLTPYTAKTIQTKNALSARLTQAREQGYAICVGEYYPQDISMSAPVFDPNGKIIAAVGTAVYSTNWTLAQVEEKLVPSICFLARTITGFTADRS